VSQTLKDAPAWRPDPSGRHPYRYFDGERWTEHVSDGQAQTVDPLPAAAADEPGVPLFRPFTSLRVEHLLVSTGAALASADPHSTMTVFRHLGLAGLFLLGLTFVGAGLSAASCHVRARAESRAREAVIAGLQIKSIPADAPDSEDVGRLVHATGVARPVGPVVDDQLGIRLDALELERTISMYQWTETCTQHDDRPPAFGADTYVESDINTPTRRNRRRDRVITWEKCVYRKEWRDAAQEILPERKERYANPSFPLEEGVHRYSPVIFSLGGLKMPTERLRDLTREGLRPMALSPEHLAGLPEALRARARIEGHAIMIGDAGEPKVGDLRIAYLGRTDMTLTVVGERDALGIKPHRLPDGTEFFQVREGAFTVSELAGARQAAVTDRYSEHAWFVPMVVIGVFLLFWPVRAWGRALPGPALFTGAGVLPFVPLATAVLYGAILSRAWWASDRSGALVAAIVAAGALVLLVTASSARLLLRARAQHAS
jgi:hypothetical protein